MVAGISACGLILVVVWAVLLLVSGSVVPELVLSAMSRVPLAGAVKVLLQVMTAPAAMGEGAGLGVQLRVAPGGKPESSHTIGATASLGPPLVQVPVTVTDCPALTVAGATVIAAFMSARGVTVRVALLTLLAPLGSLVVVPAVVVMVSGPLAGALKVLVQVIELLTVSGLGAGAQLCVAPLGKPLSAQVGVAASLGPLLMQVPVTVTDVPAAAVDALRLVVEATSACGVTPSPLASTLLPGCGSAVDEPAVVVMLSVPEVGAVKLLVHVIQLPAASVPTLGAQLNVAPAGSPVSVHVGATAGLGPSLVQVPDTVTGVPATAPSGMAVDARISARGVTPIEVEALLLAGAGSVTDDAASTSTPTLPVGGTTKLMLQLMASFRARAAGGWGEQLTDAPGGRVGKLQVAPGAPPGPRLVQVAVPVTTLPALALAGKPDSAAAMSAGASRMVTVLDTEAGEPQDDVLART